MNRWCQRVFVASSAHLSKAILWGWNVCWRSTNISCHYQYKPPQREDDQLQCKQVLNFDPLASFQGSSSWVSHPFHIIEQKIQKDPKSSRHKVWWSKILHDSTLFSYEDFKDWVCIHYMYTSLPRSQSSFAKALVATCWAAHKPGLKCFAQSYGMIYEQEQQLCL